MRENARLDRDEMAQLNPDEEKRVEAAAKLEGITFEEAMMKRRGYRFLY